MRAKIVQAAYEQPEWSSQAITHYASRTDRAALLATSPESGSNCGSVGFFGAGGRDDQEYSVPLVCPGKIEALALPISDSTFMTHTLF